MNTGTQDHGDDTLGGPLAAAVTFIRAEPAPHEAIRRTVETAAGWGDAPPPPGIFRPRRMRMATAALVGLAACMIVGIVTLALMEGRPRVVVGSNPAGPAASESGTTVPAAADGAVDRAGVTKFYMPVPVTYPVVSEESTVFVTIGPAQPALLGSRVSHADIRAGTGGGGTSCLHAWDWSKSRTSRVVTVAGAWGRLAPAALSPDGTILLNTDGAAVDLATATPRNYAGFELAKGQRVERLRFAPDARRVAALLSNSGDDDRIDAWSVRIVDLEAGKALAEFAADDVDWFAWAAFAPDGASVVHASPDNVVARRDVRTGAVLARYEPPLEPHGAVGIAVSPEGRYVAAGHYHGELFVWEAASRERVLHHAFTRADGGPFASWQAKVLAFSPDGEHLATASSGRVQVLETRTGNVAARVDSPLPAHVAHFRWSPDGGTITMVLGATVLTDSSQPNWRTTMPRADELPRVYEWAWQAGQAPAELPFPAQQGL